MCSVCIRVMCVCVCVCACVYKCCVSCVCVHKYVQVCVHMIVRRISFKVWPRGQVLKPSVTEYRGAYSGLILQETKHMAQLYYSAG